MAGRKAKKRREGALIQVNLRLPEAMRKKLVAAAKAQGRSLNAEMLARLEHSFRREEADEILEQLDARRAEVEARYEEARRALDEILRHHREK